MVQNAKAANDPTHVPVLDAGARERLRQAYDMSSLRFYRGLTFEQCLADDLLRLVLTRCAEAREREATMRSAR